MAELRPAITARRRELEELLGGLRRHLSPRDEAPGGAWLEEAVDDLLAGRKPGVYLPLTEGGGLAFYGRRGSMAFGHLHVAPGPAAVARARSVAAGLLGGLPSDLEAIDLGFTGLSTEEEDEVVEELARRPGSTVIRRQAMERRLGPEDGQRPADPPRGLARVPVREVTLEALSELDRTGFLGTVDALLLGRAPEDYRHSLEAVLGDRLGRFLDEASCALVETDPPRLLGAVLTAERSAHVASFLDLVVDPGRRHQGLGRFLLGWGLRALWAMGYERARLWVSGENLPAQGLYAAFGFRAIDAATIYRWDRGAPSPQPHEAR